VDVLLSRKASFGAASCTSRRSRALSRASDAYARFFHYYEAGLLLIVNAAAVDLAGDDTHYDGMRCVLASAAAASTTTPPSFRFAVARHRAVAPVFP
jgi:hypothetical protein